MESIVTPTEMAAIDEAAPEPVDELVERAGAAVARAALDLLGGSYGRRVVVVAGKGNNGADGRAAARRLEARGVRCTVVAATSAPDTLRPADLVIDAAYGTGFRGEHVAPRPASAQTPVLAVDVPSGVCGLTGEAAGEPLEATRTVTFAAWKPGLLLGDGASLAGQVSVADIGLDVSDARTHLVDDAAVAAWLPPRPRDTHKWRAAVRIVAGSSDMAGAAVLATGAAQRAGAGYVQLSVPGSSGAASAPVEAVLAPVDVDDWAREVCHGSDRFHALLVGPGLGRSAEVDRNVRAVVARCPLPLVVDGDGIRALGEAAAEVLAERPANAAPVLLTPHDGEFEALAGSRPGADRFASVRALAAATGAHVLAKGPTTIVAAPDGRALAVTSGDARLATAGSGDVLSGTIAAFVARGIDPFEAAAAAAHVHGRAGALAWRDGLVAGDLVRHLPAVLNRLAGG